LLEHLLSPYFPKSGCWGVREGFFPAVGGDVIPVKHHVNPMAGEACTRGSSAGVDGRKVRPAVGADAVAIQHDGVVADELRTSSLPSMLYWLLASGAVLQALLTVRVLAVLLATVLI